MKRGERERVGRRRSWWRWWRGGRRALGYRLQGSGFRREERAGRRRRRGGGRSFLLFRYLLVYLLVRVSRSLISGLLSQVSYLRSLIYFLVYLLVRVSRSQQPAIAGVRV